MDWLGCWAALIEISELPLRTEGTKQNIQSELDMIGLYTLTTHQIQIVIKIN